MRKHFALLILAIEAIAGAPAVLPCTSAIIGARSSALGRPMLWKHRDTGTEHNFVERVERPGQLTYIALFNGGDSLLSEAWMGMNQAGFMIMNTASYNLAPDTARLKDCEGRVMRRALEVCRTVDDFCRLLDTLPKPLGIQANFGVVDSRGNGGYIEADDYTRTLFMLNDSTDVIVRTNFSVSGNDTDGMGYIRYDNARHLMGDGPYTPWLFTETLSRSFYHSLLDIDAAAGDAHWVVDRDFIPRRSSAASIVMVGGDADTDEGCIMFVNLGYPPVGDIHVATVDSVPECLRPVAPGMHAPACDEAVARKRLAFPIMRGSGPNYIDMDYVRAESARRRAANLDVYRRMYPAMKVE